MDPSAEYEPVDVHAAVTYWPAAATLHVASTVFVLLVQIDVT